MSTRNTIAGVVLLILPIALFIINFPPYGDPIHLANKNLKHLTDQAEPEITHSSWSLRKIYSAALEQTRRGRRSKMTSFLLILVVSIVLGITLIVDGVALKRKNKKEDVQQTHAPNTATRRQ